MVASSSACSFVHIFRSLVCRTQSAIFVHDKNAECKMMKPQAKQIASRISRGRLMPLDVPSHSTSGTLLGRNQLPLPASTDLSLLRRNSLSNTKPHDLPTLRPNHQRGEGPEKERDGSEKDGKGRRSFATLQITDLIILDPQARSVRPHASHHHNPNSIFTPKMSPP